MIIKELKTKSCKTDYAQIISSEDFFAFDKKGAKSNYEFAYNLPEYITATKKGQKIGELLITKDGNVVKVLDVTVNEDIEKMG